VVLAVDRVRGLVATVMVQGLSALTPGPSPDRGRGEPRR
jgi:hypothetical protein